jgi:3'(2'), 5'-bisphosphate nucleotidase
MPYLLIQEYKYIASVLLFYTCVDVLHYNHAEFVSWKNWQTCDWRGEPLDFAADQTGRRIIYPWGGVLATNGALHDELVEMITATYN